MSKMRMPEMDVVRFQESDVIVASSIRIINVEDTVKKNAEVYRNDVLVGSNLDGSFTSFFNSYSPSTTFYRGNDDSPFALDTIVNDDRSGVSVPDFDGTYAYQGNGIWQKQ